MPLPRNLWAHHACKDGNLAIACGLETFGAVSVLWKDGALSDYRAGSFT